MSAEAFSTDFGFRPLYALFVAARPLSGVRKRHEKADENARRLIAGNPRQNHA
jgi:hypothetical protein